MLQSEFIIILLQLRWLHQPADLGSPVKVGLFGRALLLLLLHEVQLSVVAGELLQRDKEVTQSESELVILRVEGEETLDKRSNLLPANMLAE